MKEKMILIIDKPNTCTSCRLNDDNNGYPMCVYLHSSHGSLAFHFNGDKERNPYCPLKPMPQKRALEDFVQNNYFMGSKVDLEKMIRYVRARANNEIIDELLGEENE